jgi:phosphorylcholine metabolism protein LicD
LKQQAQESSKYKAAFDEAEFDKILSQIYGDYMKKVRDKRADL